MNEQIFKYFVANVKKRKRKKLERYCETLEFCPTANFPSR